jgi:hypothetical protein
MLEINYPEPDFKTRNEDGKDRIFDVFRKKWLLLTPEEWVRQNFIRYLLSVKKYPASLIALEKVIMLGELRKRFDVLVYDTGHQPWMMVECKAPQVVLDDSTVQQALRYNLSIPVRYIIVTNGPVTWGWERKSSGLVLLNDMPEWDG